LPFIILNIILNLNRKKKIIFKIVTFQITAGIRDLVAESMIKNDKLNNSFSFTLNDEEDEEASIHLNEGLVTLNDSPVVLSDLKPRLKQKVNRFTILFTVENHIYIEISSTKWSNPLEF
jgi:uncharacterized membrane protein